MSIASQLTALEGNISDAYDMVAQRGGTVPARKNMENLDDAIATIPSGSSNVFPMPMTTVVNGKVEKDSFAQSYTLPSNITDIGDRVFYNATMSDILPHTATSFIFSSLTAVSGNYAFYRAFGNLSAYGGNIISIDFSNVVTVSGEYAFEHAFSYTYGSPGDFTVDFSSLATITGEYAFENAFSYNDCIQSISFPSLSNLGSYTNQFDAMLDGCTGVTVHFPAALQSTIGSWTSVQNGFGGTNTTVLFDL